MVFDLKDPFNSTCWNPMTRPFEFNERANNLEKENTLISTNSNLCQISVDISNESKIKIFIKTLAFFYGIWYD